MIDRIVRLANAYMDWAEGMGRPGMEPYAMLIIYGLFALMVAMTAVGYLAFPDGITFGGVSVRQYLGFG